jgi:hypothetical protein
MADEEGYKEKDIMDKKIKKIVIVTLVALLAVILLPLLGHYPPRIIDALTLQPAEGYGIHVPWFRILFEPFLGLLLFFNRSLYALTEVPYALAWLFVLYLIWSIWRGALISDRRVRRRWFGGRVADLPLVGGVLLTFFVVMIFLRLPGNTIVNNTKDDILVTTHCHTEWSHDGLISQKAQWRWQRRNGFEAFFITDHNNHDRTLEFVRAQRRGEVPPYPLVMGGEEFSGTNHLSLLGLKTDFSTKGYPDTMAVAATRADSGAVIVNHWFDGEHMTLEYYRDLGVDGFEIENTATDRYYPRDVYHRIRSFCEENHLIMNGGLDFHGYGNVCSLWNAFTLPGWHNLSQDEQERAILLVLRSRDQHRLKVLLYHDRPYYDKKNLWYRPPLTLWHYFRSLNTWQVLSWIFWLLLLAWGTIRLAGLRDDRKNRLAGHLIAGMGMAGALFILALALRFQLLSPKVAGYNDIYPEYAQLFFIIGGIFFVYAALVTGIRGKSKK